MSNAAMVERKAGCLRVALLTNEIPPYRVPLYQALAGTPGWEFAVFTCTAGMQSAMGRDGTEGVFSSTELALSYLRKEHYGSDGIHRGHGDPCADRRLGISALPARRDSLFGDGVRKPACRGLRSAHANAWSCTRGTSHTERNISARQHARRLLAALPCSHLQRQRGRPVFGTAWRASGPDLRGGTSDRYRAVSIPARRPMPGRQRGSDVASMVGVASSPAS